ncbi:MAG: DUF190 domain-containing protein, partial [Alphaproteobacteria bacterium]
LGLSAHVHRRHVLESDRAVVVEIVDEDRKLRSCATQLADIPDIGLITLEAVEIIIPMSSAGSEGEANQ